MRKSNLKFQLAPLKLVSNFKNPSTVKPQAAILILKIHSRLWFCKIIAEAAFDKLILAHLPCSQREVGTREHRSITEKGILRRVSLSICKIRTYSESRTVLLLPRPIQWYHALANLSEPSPLQVVGNEKKVGSGRWQIIGIGLGPRQSRFFCLLILLSSSILCISISAPVKQNQ